jgi:N-acetylglucosamine malate deacetylase 1
MQDNIIFFCAHNDDQIIGAGGTIAKYSKENKKIITVIFSYGEKSHPWIKAEHIINTRIKEALDSNNILGGDEIIFLDLKEGNFSNEFKEKEIETKIKKLIEDFNPKKIFFHSKDDPHPDHKAVNKFIINLINNNIIKCEAYTFDVWTIIDLKIKQESKMVVDISNTLKTKVKAFKKHKSQKFALFSLLWSVYLKAFLYGLNYNYKYAEVFNKINRTK